MYLIRFYVIFVRKDDTSDFFLIDWNFCLGFCYFWKHDILRKYIDIAAAYFVTVQNCLKNIILLGLYKYFFNV